MKTKLCGCGERAEYESTVKRRYCSDCGTLLQKHERELEKYQKQKREKPKTK